MGFVRMSWPEKVTIGESFSIQSEWKNAGVAPCYRGGYICYTIKDEKGGIVAVLSDEQFNFKKLQTGEPGKSPSKKINSEFTIGSNFEDVSVGNKDGTPLYELPYSGNDGFKRYKLGEIEVVA